MISILLSPVCVVAPAATAEDAVDEETGTVLYRPPHMRATELEADSERQGPLARDELFLPFLHAIPSMQHGSEGIWQCIAFFSVYYCKHSRSSISHSRCSYVASLPLSARIQERLERKREATRRSALFAEMQAHLTEVCSILSMLQADSAVAHSRGFVFTVLSTPSLPFCYTIFHSALWWCAFLCLRTCLPCWLTLRVFACISVLHRRPRSCAT